MKEVEFLGNTLSIIKNFPELARREAGYELSKFRVV